MPRTRRKPKEILQGDVWDFTSNNGHIVRKVIVIYRDRVTYECCGRRRLCWMDTFQKWARGAELMYATNWNGRD